MRGRFFATVSKIWLDSEWPEISSHSNTAFEKAVVPRISLWYGRCRDVVRQQLAEVSLHFELCRLLTCGINIFTKAVLRDSYQILEANVDPDQEYTAFHALWRLVHSLHTNTPLEHQSNLIAHLAFSDESPNSPEYGLVDRERVLCRVEGAAGVARGWAGCTAQVSDHLCILAGAPFPLELRGCGDGAYKLLGEMISHQM